MSVMPGTLAQIAVVSRRFPSKCPTTLSLDVLAELFQTPAVHYLEVIRALPSVCFNASCLNRWPCTTSSVQIPLCRAVRIAKFQPKALRALQIALLARGQHFSDLGVRLI